MASTIPAMPASVRASALLHGSPADFVTNAYLALQRQWPDQGGFAHYTYTLSQPNARRADVLREIAASPNARACGVQFIDDLPADHEFRPEDHDNWRLLESHVKLRLGRTVADVAELRQAMQRLTGDELSGAVEALVLAQQANQAALESQLSTLRAEVRQGLRQAQPERLGTQPEQNISVRPELAEGPPHAAWRHLAAQQIAMARQLAESREEAAALRAELAELKASLAATQEQAQRELKREVADYVNALAAAQRTQNHIAPPPAAPTLAHARPPSPRPTSPRVAAARPLTHTPARTRAEHD